MSIFERHNKFIFNDVFNDEVTVKGGVYDGKKFLGLWEWMPQVRGLKNDSIGSVKPFFLSHAEPMESLTDSDSIIYNDENFEIERIHIDKGMIRVDFNEILAGKVRHKKLAKSQQSSESEPKHGKLKIRRT